MLNNFKDSLEYLIRSDWTTNCCFAFVLQHHYYYCFSCCFYLINEKKSARLGELHYMSVGGEFVEFTCISHSFEHFNLPSETAGSAIVAGYTVNKEKKERIFCYFSIISSFFFCYQIT
jgi:hypothetical protein